MIPVGRRGCIALPPRYPAWSVPQCGQPTEVVTAALKMKPHSQAYVAASWLTLARWLRSRPGAAACRARRVSSAERRAPERERLIVIGRAKCIVSPWLTTDLPEGFNTRC